MGTRNLSLLSHVTKEGGYVMRFNMKSDFISWGVLFGIVVLLLEVSFFNQGVIFSLLVAMGIIYIGRKRFHKFFGKLCFWFGIALFAVNILSMMSFRLLLIAILVYIIMEYAQSRKESTHIQPIIKEPFGEHKPAETLIRKKPLFENRLFGERKTAQHVYEWNDINIVTAVGNTTIDLSYTVLPKGETVIFIRGILGNLQVSIPYDVEVCVSHSVIAGKTNILQNEGEKMFNQCLQFQTEEYEKAEQKVKIFTSILIGDLEVKRV